jgi:hypothetical protein
MSWDFLTDASLPPWHLLGTLGPLAFGDPRGTYWPGLWNEWHERLLYVGIVPLVAASRAAGRWRWACWGGAALAVALAFGRYVPWYAWTQALPGYPTFRIPSKHLTLAALALALAAGLGISRLHGRRVALAALAGAALLSPIGPAADWLPAVAVLLGGSEKLALPAVRESAVALAAAGLRPSAIVLLVVAMLALLPASWGRRGLLLLAIVELGVVLQPYRVDPADPQVVVAQAEPLRGHARAAVVGDQSAVLANFGMVLRVTQPGGYVPLFSGEYMALLTGTANASVVLQVAQADDPALPLLGYGVVVDREKSLVMIAEPPPPQAWVARCTWPGTARDVREPDFPRRACIARATTTERELPVPSGPARVMAEGAGRLLVEAEGPGWLVTTRPWYPGWSAWLDGAPAPVEVVDGALVGLALPTGQHTVSFSYRPAGLEAGLVISIGAALGLVDLWRRRF